MRLTSVTIWLFSIAKSPLYNFFSYTRFSSYDHLRNLHVFVWPSYVLDPNTQDGKKLPNWSPHYQHGQYLRVSPFYYSTIRININPNTGFITPHYHVIYDNHFKSVPNTASYGLVADNPSNDSSWQKLFWSGVERHTNSEDFYPSNQNCRMPELHLNCITPDDRRRPFTSVTD